MWDDKPKPTDAPTPLPAGAFAFGLAVGVIVLACVVCGVVLLCRRRHAPEAQSLNADAPPAYVP